MRSSVNGALVACLAAVCAMTAAGPAAAQFSGPPPPMPFTPVERIINTLPPPEKVPFRMVQPSLPPDAPMPATDPRDLGGTWMHIDDLVFRIETDMFGLPLPYNEAGAQVLARRVKANKGGTPYLNASALCRPPGAQWQLDLNFPFHVFMSQRWIEFVFEEYHGKWNIELDPAADPSPGEHSYMGRSVGHWVGDTLVVETGDFRKPLWLDTNGTPMSASGHIEQRIRKVNLGDREPYMEIVTTVTDPAYYARPWTIVRRYAWRPDRVIMKEYNCEEQVGDPSVDSAAGLIEEPRG